jgi:hypothetical protein
MRSVRFAAIGVAVFAGLAFAGTAFAAKKNYPSSACPQSSTGLASCIAGSSDGDTITVKSGTYLENTIPVAHAVTIQGKCNNPAVIDAADIGGAFDAHDAFDIQHIKVTIRCLGFVHALYAVNDSNASTGTGGFKSLTVSQNRFQTLGHAVGLSGGANGAVISNNVLTGIDHRAIWVDPMNTNLGANDVKVLGNTDTTSDYDFIESDAPGNHWTISGNTVSNIDDDFVQWNDPLTNSTISGNTTNGLEGRAVSLGQVAGNNGNIVSGNTFANIDWDAVKIMGDDNVVSGNQLNGFIDGNGVFVVGARTILSGNTITGGAIGDGFRLSGPGPFTVSKNTAGGSYVGDDFSVTCQSACAGTQITKNTALNNQDASPGFQISDAGCAAYPCLTITSNKADRIEGASFWLHTSYANISGNAATNGGGFDNSCSGCPTAGFYLSGIFNRVTTNQALQNNYDGFSIAGNNNTVSWNLANNNGMHGLQVGRLGEASSANTLSYNTATGNRGDGVTVRDTTGAKSNAVDHTTASGNRKDCTVFDFNSVTPGTLLPAAGNHCADGSNFTVLQSIFP